MQAFISFINNVLGPIGIVIGIVTFFPVIYLWWDATCGRKRRRDIWFKQAQGCPGKKPAILIVDLHEKYNIRTSVEDYRQRVDGLKAIPGDRLFEISRTKWLTPSDMPALVDEIQDKAAEIVRAGTDTVHLFYAGPVMPPAIIGAIFANTCSVKLYQHTHQGQYVDWGPLRHDLS